MHCLNTNFNELDRFARKLAEASFRSGREGVALIESELNPHDIKRCHMDMPRITKGTSPYDELNMPLSNLGIPVDREQGMKRRRESDVSWTYQPSRNRKNFDQLKKISQARDSRFASADKGRDYFIEASVSAFGNRFRGVRHVCGSIPIEFQNRLAVRKAVTYVTGQNEAFIRSTSEFSDDLHIPNVHQGFLESIFRLTKYSGWTTEEQTLLKNMLVVAAEGYRLDLRRSSGQPFIVHPLAVSIFAFARRKSSAALIICLLHDFIEDSRVYIKPPLQDDRLTERERHLAGRQWLLEQLDPAKSHIIMALTKAEYEERPGEPPRKRGEAAKGAEIQRLVERPATLSDSSEMFDHIAERQNIKAKDRLDNMGSCLNLAATSVYGQLHETFHRILIPLQTSLTIDASVRNRSPITEDTLDTFCLLVWEFFTTSVAFYKECLLNDIEPPLLRDTANRSSVVEKFKDKKGLPLKIGYSDVYLGS